jgi:hypothetical protein
LAKSLKTKRPRLTLPVMRAKRVVALSANSLATARLAELPLPVIQVFSGKTSISAASLATSRPSSGSPPVFHALSDLSALLLANSSPMLDVMPKFQALPSGPSSLSASSFTNSSPVLDESPVMTLS